MTRSRIGPSQGGPKTTRVARGSLVLIGIPGSTSFLTSPGDLGNTCATWRMRWVVGSTGDRSRGSEGVLLSGESDNGGDVVQVRYVLILKEETNHELELS